MVEKKDLHGTRKFVNKNLERGEIFVLRTGKLEYCRYLKNREKNNFIKYHFLS